MDHVDRAILNETQSNFPITAQPYLELGKRLNLSESEVIERVKRLKENKIIRRIGGNFNSHKLNFKSTLCSAKVSPEKLDKFVQMVNSFPGVTHNYLRDHAYNVWFTFIAPDMAFIDRALEDISHATGVNELQNLPAVKVFKIKVDFDV